MPAAHEEEPKGFVSVIKLLETVQDVGLVIKHPVGEVKVHVVVSYSLKNSSVVGNWILITELLVSLFWSVIDIW